MWNKIQMPYLHDLAPDYFCDLIHLFTFSHSMSATTKSIPTSGTLHMLSSDRNVLSLSLYLVVPYFHPFFTQILLPHRPS